MQGISRLPGPAPSAVGRIRHNAPVNGASEDLTRYPYRWWWRVRLAERKDQMCRVVARGRGSVLVEFPDGFRVVTSRHAVRRR